MKLIYLIPEFFGLDFFKFSGPLWSNVVHICCVFLCMYNSRVFNFTHFSVLGNGNLNLNFAKTYPKPFLSSNWSGTLCRIFGYSESAEKRAKYKLNKAFFHFLPNLWHVWWFFKVLQHLQCASFWKIIKYAKKCTLNSFLHGTSITRNPGFGHLHYFYLL